ncbi:MAG: 5-oxoprolinase subunit PxpB [Flavobacteriaceae bacterium]|nr:5-oxoprolinase subunit PxpB [Flavobacteriaceae bacterium]
MSNFKLTYKQFGERSILVEWPSKIDEKTLKDIILFKEKFENSTLKELIEVKLAYNSMLVSYHTAIDNIYDKILELKSIYSSKNKVINSIYKLWKIPVCYDAKFALDLGDISIKKGISKQDIIAIHSKAIYTVFFIGFLPGFLYLGGLNEAINFPRKPTPRMQIEKGAVAIAGNQTGVYPCKSPGGWNIIGNSPINFFDIAKNPPCFAKPGDKIQFYPITKKKHSDITTLVDAGVFQLESEVIRG